MLRDQPLVVFGSTYWDDPPVTPRQMTEILARENRVLYFEPPASYLHLRNFRRNSVWLRWLSGLRRERVAGGGELWVCTPPPSLPWKTRWPWSNELTQRCHAPFLRHAINATGMEDPVLLTFLPHHCALVDRLPHRLLCYYSIDEWTALSRYVHPAVIREYEERIVARADIVFATAQGLVERLRRLNPSTHWVANGVDAELYGRALNPAVSAAPELAALPHPIIGFSGALDFRLDQELLCDIARARPHWSFVFIGLAATNLQRLRALANVHFLGWKRTDELPACFKAFDVGVIPYVENGMTRHIYPVKLNEYFAAGLAVVATPLPELLRLADMQPKSLPPLVRLAASSAAFLHELESALNDSAGRERRIAFARQNTWEERARTLSACIEEKLAGSASAIRFRTGERHARAAAM